MLLFAWHGFPSSSIFMVATQNDAYSCPGLQDTFTDLLMASGALCIVGAMTALLGIMTVCGCGLNLCAGRTRFSRTRTASTALPTVAVV
jgi:uncharacterized Zn-binding protein involved in type VI secretion